MRKNWSMNCSLKCKFFQETVRNTDGDLYAEILTYCRLESENFQDTMPSSNTLDSGKRYHAWTYTSILPVRIS